MSQGKGGPLLRSRLMIVGEGRVGKTSLKQAMIEVRFYSFHFNFELHFLILEQTRGGGWAGDKEHAGGRPRSDGAGSYWK